MTLSLKLKYKGKCEHHPRYNPEIEGEGGIRGACRQCRWLYDMYRDYLRFFGNLNVGPPR